MMRKYARSQTTYAGRAPPRSLFVIPTCTACACDAMLLLVGLRGVKRSVGLLAHEYRNIMREGEIRSLVIVEVGLCI